MKTIDKEDCKVKRNLLLIVLHLTITSLSGCIPQNTEKYELNDVKNEKAFTNVSVENISESIEKVFYDALYPVYVDGHMEYMSGDGRIVTNYQFDYADFFYDGMGIVTKDGLMGSVDLSGELVISCQYQELGRFSCGRTMATDENGKKGYLDCAGNVIIPFEYCFARDFSDNIAIVSRESPLYEFIDTMGVTQGAAGFYRTLNWGDFHDGLMLNQYSYYNLQGECVIPDTVHYIYAEGYYPSVFSEKLAVVPKLKPDFYAEWEDVNAFFNGENWYYIYIDTEGKQAFEKEFESAASFSEGLAVVRENGKRGVIDTTGEFVFYDDRILQWGEYLEGSVIYVEKENGTCQFGFLDRNGNVMIPAMYYEIYDGGFRNGLALVAADMDCCHWKYINKDNEEVYAFDVPEGFWMW